MQGIESRYRSFEKGFVTFADCSSQLEYDAADPDFMNSWHLSRLNMRTQTLVKIGENAANLVNSYPAKAPERTTLRQHLCQSTIYLIVPHLRIDIKACGVREVFGISYAQSCRTQLRENNAISMPIYVIYAISFHE
jgi:hypothetical protein